MACYPTSATGLNYDTEPAGPTIFPAVVVTSDVTANTKGTYTEIWSSTPFACNAINIGIPAIDTATPSFLADVSIGAGGAEAVLLPNLMFAGDGSSTNGVNLGPIPVAIASGTRIAMRSQDDEGSNTFRPFITIAAAGGCPGITTWNTYGVTTATSVGSSVDPGATIDTKGAYTEVSASTGAVTQWLLIMLSLGGNGAPTTARWAVDIATGAGGGESVLIPDLRFLALASPTLLSPNCWPFMTYVASGTRIASRSSCTTNNATDRLFQIAILAGTAPAEAGGGASAHTFIG